MGGGIFEKLGGVLITDNLNFVFAGAGGNTFVGGGEAYWLGAPQTRCLLTTSQNGVGMVRLGLPSRPWTPNTNHKHSRTQN